MFEFSWPMRQRVEAIANLMMEANRLPDSIMSGDVVCECDRLLCSLIEYTCGEDVATYVRRHGFNLGANRTPLLDIESTVDYAKREILSDCICSLLDD